MALLIYLIVGCVYATYAKLWDTFQQTYYGDNGYGSAFNHFIEWILFVFGWPGLVVFELLIYTFDRIYDFIERKLND